MEAQNKGVVDMACSKAVYDNANEENLENMGENENRRNDYTRSRYLIGRNIARVVLLILLITTCVSVGAVGVLLWHTTRPVNPCKLDGIALPEAPVIPNAPVQESIGKSFVVVSWSAPVNMSENVAIGYTINIKAPHDIDWSNVGYVSSGQLSEFSVSRLSSDTTYLVMVAVVTRDPKKTNAPGPYTEIKTLALASPILLEDPVVKEVGKTHFVVKWGDGHTNDGPIIGFNIKLKSASSADWVSVGFVTDQSQREFNVTRLASDTLYHVMVVLVTIDAGNGVDGPIVSTRTQALIPSVLAYPPQVKDIQTTNAVIAWNDTFDGDSPALGYVTNIRKRIEQADWLKVGYVSQNAPRLEYNITGLWPSTSYDAMVSMVCLSSSAEGEKPGPVIEIQTLDLVFPTLTDAPVYIDVGISYVGVHWNKSFVGHGPVVGYTVNKRPSDRAPDGWMSVGFVDLQSERVFNITGLAAYTSYDVAVSVVPSFTEAPLDVGPIINVRTLAIHRPVLRDSPHVYETQDSYFMVRWGEEFYGTGPVIGYSVNLRRSGTLDWISVGFVASGSLREYKVTQLLDDTSYDLVVSLVTGNGAGYEISGPDITVRTRPYDIPVLANTPRAENIGQTYIQVTWDPEFDGQGPIIGYLVNIRTTGARDWLTKGFLPLTSSSSWQYYTVDGLTSGTSYDVMISLVHSHTGKAIETGPVLHNIRTSYVTPANTPPKGSQGSRAPRTEPSSGLVIIFLTLLTFLQHYLTTIST